MVNIYPGFIGGGAAAADDPTVAPLPLPTPKAVLFLLGYREYQTNEHVVKLVRQNLADYEEARVVEILAELKVIDEQIRQALADSAVSKTCSTEMSWPAHIKMLRGMGDALLRELSRIYDVDLAHSKYEVVYNRRVTIQYQ